MTPCNVNKKNVYVGFVTADSYPEMPKNFQADRDSLKNGDYFLRYWGNGTGDAPVNNSFLKKDVEYTLATGYENFKANYDISYCTIPYNYNGVKMYKKLENNVEKWCYGNQTDDVDKNNTVLGFYWKGFNQDGLTAAYEQTKVNGELAKAAGISKFYSKAEAVVDNTLDLKATAQGTVTYTSSKTDVATVDGKGLVTTKKAGKTTITVTSTGVYGDKITAKCELTVSKEPVKSSYIPIVTNMKIEGKTGSETCCYKGVLVYQKRYTKRS
ncbi:MAG TPA: Ig-like domain-containing protein [Ruminococcus bromii]|nr:Ig-like domain-containing protein [Ruminococcus bromii]